MRPAPRLILLLALWTLVGLLPAWRPETTPIWLTAGGLLLAFAALDGRKLRALAPPSAERFLRAASDSYAALAVGVWSWVRIRLHNPHPRPMRLIVFDHYPQPAQLAGQPQTVRIDPAAWAEIRYRVRPLERGETAFGSVQVLMDSRFGLWRRDLRLGTSLRVRVYPNFANIAKFTLLAAQNRVAAMGIHKRRRRGEGQDFLQLREYREGDSLRQIDWKATSRSRKLISKDYQDEQDQTVVFLLDCSRRMRARDGDLSHFDHALNALILLSYVALQQGDAVGVLNFGGPPRWLKPRKGHNELGRIVHGLYDLQPTLHPPDYSEAAMQLAARQPKRALIVILTNLKDEDSDELQPAVRLLARRHLVLLANLREAVLDQTLEQPIRDFRQACLHAAVCHYLAARERCQEKLRRQGALLLDVSPQQLPVAIVNRYLDIKRSGRL